MFLGSKTAGAILAGTRNPAGFDYLRLVLSVGVLAFHCVTITQGRNGEQAVWDAVSQAIAPRRTPSGGYALRNKFRYLTAKV